METKTKPDRGFTRMNADDEQVLGIRADPRKSAVENVMLESSQSNLHAAPKLSIVYGDCHAAGPEARAVPLPDDHRTPFRPAAHHRDLVYRVPGLPVLHRGARHVEVAWQHSCQPVRALARRRARVQRDGPRPRSQTRRLCLHDGPAALPLEVRLGRRDDRGTQAAVSAKNTRQKAKGKRQNKKLTADLRG